MIWLESKQPLSLLFKRLGGSSLALESGDYPPNIGVIGSKHHSILERAREIGTEIATRFTSSYFLSAIESWVFPIPMPTTRDSSEATEP
jgi:hypothetical protein